MARFDPRASGHGRAHFASVSSGRAADRVGARTTPSTPSTSRGNMDRVRSNMAAIQSKAPSAGAKQIFSGATPTSVGSGPAKATAAKVASPSPAAGSSIAEAASGARESRGVGTKVEAREQPTRRTIDWMDRASNMETASSVVSSKAANEVQQIRQAYDAQVGERQAGVVDAARMPVVGGFGERELGDTVTTPGQEGSPVDTVYEGTSAPKIREGQEWTGKAPETTLDAEAGPSFKPTVTPGKVEGGGVTPATVDAQVRGTLDGDGSAHQRHQREVGYEDSGITHDVTYNVQGTSSGKYGFGGKGVPAEDVMSGKWRIKEDKEDKERK